MSILGIIELAVLRILMDFLILSSVEYRSYVTVFEHPVVFVKHLIYMCVVHTH
jgi:hypothetical protein